MKVDKMSMAHSLEIRAPFLDTDLISYFFGLENIHKKNRSLFRKTVSKILPKEIMRKKKQGFTLPLSTWFTERDFNERLNPHFKNLLKRKLFSSEGLKKIIFKPKDFKNDHKLWVLLNFEIWNKIYLEGVNPKKIEL
jgi:asparagine synthase (glutamine-hydrolysing)